ncbi:MAG: SusC/RagA family TonB-linked outer membrane protein [Prevotella sp.]|jgi:TonB-linked SusC/RagA family outer membrane protein|nr:SusC/RagA family TonB-linked outer membrane protein [Prevotella sp.]
MTNFRKVFGCLLFLFIAVQASVFAQVTVSANNTSIKQVIRQIGTSSGYSFFYSDDALDLDRKITVNIKNESIEAALSKVFAGTNIRYVIKPDKQILLTSEKNEDSVNQAAKKYSGTVTDASNGEPLIGVNIVLKGGQTGTVTDVGGEFSIEALAGSTFVISYIGYFTQEIKVSNQTNLQITLKEDTKSLDEVVVVGYGTMNRKNLATAISTVKTENIAKSALSNMSQMLLGRAAGLLANITSPQPGGDVSLSIRGSGTPIFIVDGVMMPTGSLELGNGQTELMQSVHRSGLAGLNPNDIESIEILKDASAAIYGIGTANGVVLITTKSGTEGKPSITFDSNWSLVTNYPYLKPLNAYEYMNIANVFNKENYLLVNNMYPYGDNPYDNKCTPTFYPHQIDAAETTDWLSYVMKNGSISNQNISISGGSKQLRYYLSGNYYNHDGTVVNSGMERFALRTNVSSQLFNFLKLTAIINVNQNNYVNSSAEGGATWSRNLVGSLHNALAYPSNLPVKGADGKHTIFTNYSNPVDMARMSDHTRTDGFYVNFAADVDIIKNILSARFMYGVNKENGNRNYYLPSDLYFFSMYKSRGHIGYSERKNETMEATVSFKKQFGEWLRLDAVAGMGRYINQGTWMNLDYENANDVIGNDKVDAAVGPYYPSSGKNIDERRSQFIRASADLLDKYVVTATLRRDGTDKFFPGKKYALFPSVSLAWKLSNENFLKNIGWIDLLKIRASYGKTGLDNLGVSMYSNFALGSQYIKFSENTVTYIPFQLSGPDYPNVTWEKTVMKDVGLDFSLFKDRIWGSFDWYRNDVTDLLRNANAPLLSMTGTIPVNYGHFYRTGWDGSINTLNVQIPGVFKWTSLLTLSRFDAYWVEREPGYDYLEYQLREHEPLNAYYSYHQDGIINIDRSNMPESQRSLPAEAQLPGYPIVKDKNGDGEITTDDVYVDNTVPEISIGFGNTFTYKNFDLDIFLYGQFGYQKTNYALSWANASGQLNQTDPRNTIDLSYNMWNSQTNPNGTLPGIAIIKTVALPGNAGLNITRQNASFVRVRDIVLGYNLSGSKLGVAGNYIRNIRLFVNVQNPFTFTKFTGFDPEIVSGYGASMAEYPMTRTFSAGAKIIF